MGRVLRGGEYSISKGLLAYALQGSNIGQYPGPKPYLEVLIPGILTLLIR